jgi:hypothetical protein
VGLRLIPGRCFDGDVSGGQTGGNVFGGYVDESVGRDAALRKA